LVYFYNLDKRSNIFNTTQIVFIIIASMIIVMTTIDIIIVLVRRKNVDKIDFKLEANDKYIKFYRIIPSILSIFAFLNLTVSKNAYVLSISLVMASVGLFCIVRAKCFPIGLSEKGLMFFGEIYNTDSITKCYVDVDNKQLEFKINNSILGADSMNSIILKLSNVSLDDLIAFLNKKKIDIKIK